MGSLIGRGKGSLADLQSRESAADAERLLIREKSDKRLFWPIRQKGPGDAQRQLGGKRSHAGPQGRELAAGAERPLIRERSDMRLFWTKKQNRPGGAKRQPG